MIRLRDVPHGAVAGEEAALAFDDTGGIRARVSPPIFVAMSENTALSESTRSLATFVICASSRATVIGDRIGGCDGRGDGDAGQQVGEGVGGGGDDLLGRGVCPQPHLGILGGLDLGEWDGRSGDREGSCGPWRWRENWSRYWGSPLPSVPAAP